MKNTTKIENQELGQQAKAILRGGTFHRVQVILEPGQDYIEHCGLSYRVTSQKDSKGRTICVMMQDEEQKPSRLNDPGYF